MMTRASFKLEKISRFRYSSLSLPVKLSQDPFSRRLPDSMYSVLVPSCASHCRRALAIISARMALRLLGEAEERRA